MAVAAEPPDPVAVPVKTAYQLAGLNLAGLEVTRAITVRATAYDACVSCTGKTDGITKTGTRAQAGRTIAVDPRVIPLGSRVFIPELGRVYVAEDTGGAILENRIDIYMDTHQEALEFGVRQLTLLILREPAVM